jgi:hypothetical protein
METTHKLLHLDKRILYNERSWKQLQVLLENVLFNGPFECGDGTIFELLRRIQNLHNSTWDHGILYAGRFLWN